MKGIKIYQTNKRALIYLSILINDSHVPNKKRAFYYQTASVSYIEQASLNILSFCIKMRSVLCNIPEQASTSSNIQQTTQVSWQDNIIKQQQARLLIQNQNKKAIYQRTSTSCNTVPTEQTMSIKQQACLSRTTRHTVRVSMERSTLYRTRSASPTDIKIPARHFI